MQLDIMIERLKDVEDKSHYLKSCLHNALSDQDISAAIRYYNMINEAECIMVDLSDTIECIMVDLSDTIEEQSRLN